jgi:tRNA threonylcarbamoyladenosine biosynthesis protein TsaB
MGEEHLCSPHEVIFPENGEWSGAGDGFLKYGHDLLSRPGFKLKLIEPLEVPNAEALLHLAKIKFEEGRCVSASQAVPVYLR